MRGKSSGVTSETFQVNLPGEMFPKIVKSTRYNDAGIRQTILSIYVFPIRFISMTCVTYFRITNQ